jgi:hypothetical protein
MRILGRLAAVVLAVVLFHAGVPELHAQNGGKAMMSVPTTKVLAIGTLSSPMTEEMQKGIMSHEVPDTVKLYLSGKIDQWYVRKDGKGVVFILNVTSTEEAHDLLEKLPLGQAKLMTFDLMPLGPLAPLGLLLHTDK